MEQATLPGVKQDVYDLPDKVRYPTKDGWNPIVQYRLVQTEEQLAELTKALDEHGKQGFDWDTEGSGLKPELGDRICGHSIGMTLGEHAYVGFYVPIRHVGTHNDDEPQLDPELVSETLKPYFASGEGEIGTFHFKYDAKMALYDGIEIKRNWVDAGIEANIANENEPSFQMKRLMAKYGSDVAKNEEDVVKNWLRKDARSLGIPYRTPKKGTSIDSILEQSYLERFGYSRAPIKLLAKYAIHDVLYTRFLLRRYHRVRHNYPDLWKREHEINGLLRDLEYRGLPVDEQLIRGTHERTKAAVMYWLEKLKTLVPDFFETLEDEFTASVPQIRALLYSHLKLTAPIFTKKGEPATDLEAREILRRQHPEHDLIWQALGKLAGEPRVPGLLKLHSTYAGNYLKFYSPAKGTINPSYNLTETKAEGGIPKTGRMSSSDPNNQNVSGATIHLYDCYCSTCCKEFEKDVDDSLVLFRGYLENSVSVRRYFIVPKGWVRVYLDFSQIELRVLAWFCQDPNLLEAYRNDEDVHQRIADMLKIQRKIAKQVNFGNSYGMQAQGLAKRMPGYYADPKGVEAQAEIVLANYFRTFPKILEFRKTFAQKMIKRGNSFVNPFGRPRRIPTINSYKKWERARAERMMMSSIISGTAADLMKESMLRTNPIAEAFGGHMVQTIHDEVVFDLPRKPGWTRVVRNLAAAMEYWPFFSEDRVYDGEFKRGVPIKTSLELSTTTWEGKKEVTILPNGNFELAA